MFSRQNIGGRKRKTKQSKAKNNNNKTLCAIFTWIVPRKYQNGCPNTTERDSETTENKQRKNERNIQKATYLMSSCRKLDTHT